MLPPDATRTTSDPYTSRVSDLRSYAEQLRGYLSSEEALRHGLTAETDILTTPIRFESGGRVFGGRFVGELIDWLIELGLRSKEWLHSAAAKLTIGELLQFLDGVLSQKESASTTTTSMAA